MTPAWRDALRAGAVLAVLPNLLLGGGAAAAGASRPFVDLDYFVVAAAALYVSAPLLAILMTVALTLDVAFTFAPVFNFGPTETVAAVEEILNFRGRALVVAIVCVAIIVLAAVALVRLRGRRPDAPGLSQSRHLALYAGVIFTFVVADVANGSNAVRQRRHRVIPDLAASPTVNVATSAAVVAGTPEPGGPMPAVTDALRAAIAATRKEERDLPDRILLVEVESMGLPEGVDTDSLFKPLLSESITRRFVARTGTVSFYGATTSGELRSLCGRRMNHFNAAALPPSSCLPAQLRAHGYETVAIHGYGGALFHRREWYPHIGFDRIAFLEQLERPGRLPRCGIIFNGACDRALLPRIRDELTRAPGTKRFIYWLTLSSHFPLDLHGPQSAQACGPLGDAGKDTEVCILWTALWPVISGIAQLAADSTVPPAWIVLVGDHAPRVVGAGEHPFSTERVPFIELRPRRR